MAKNEWEEIKKLAADFQRTQLSTSFQSRLSERNCIDLVNKLIQLNLIQVIFTCDGKEYVTPDHLQKEINDELIVSGGRVDLTDLVSILNIDFSHIESKAVDLVRESEGSISLVLGQLINDDYKNRLAEEINERLSTSGIITISELTKSYDLPADFLEEILNERLDETKYDVLTSIRPQSFTRINGVRDPTDHRTIYTHAYMDQYRHRIRGVLLALTKPTSVPSLISKYKFPDKIFNSIVESLVSSGSINGTISSSKIFTPEFYVKRQKEWVEDFFNRNSYLEYDALSRLGISDPKPYVQKKYGSEVISLKTCVVTKSLLHQLESTVEEVASNKEFLDLRNILPSVLSDVDLDTLLSQVSSDKLSGVHLMSSSFIVSKDFLESLKPPFEDLMQKRAEEDLKDGKLFPIFTTGLQTSGQASEDQSTTGQTTASKKDERKKKSAAKVNTGGGTQGREVKIKNTKRKYNTKSKRDDDEDEDYGDRNEDSNELVFMSRHDISAHLKKSDKDLQELIESNDSDANDLIDSLSDHLYPELNKKYLQVAKQVFIANTSQDSKSSKKKTHSDLSSHITKLHSTICLYEKGLNTIVDNESLKSQLTKYLQRTLCTEALNSLVNYSSSDDNPNLSNPDSRVKVINKLSDADQKESLNKLNISLNGSDMNQFIQDLETSASKVNILLKPVDKKREKNLLAEHKQDLLLQLESTDPSLILHVSVLILYQTIFGAAIHASGKFVPQLIQIIKSHLEPESSGLLTEAEHQVVLLFKMNQNNESEDEKQGICRKLMEDLLPKIQKLATEYKHSKN